MTTAARGPHFSLTCIIFQALCKTDIQGVGRTDYSAVLGGVNYGRKTTTFRRHCPRFRFPIIVNAYGRYMRTGNELALIM